MNSLVLAVCLLQPMAKKIEALPITAFNVSADGTTVVGRIVHQLGVNDEPCYWTKATGTRPLDKAGYQWGTAYAASQDGSRIVGLVSKDKQQFVALWEKGKKAQIIASWEAHWSSHGHFPSISGDGKWVVGSSQFRPFRWSKATGGQFLKPLDPRLTRGTITAASFDGSTLVGGSEGPITLEENSSRMMAGDTFDKTGLLGCMWVKAGAPTMLEVGKYPQTSDTCVSEDGLSIVGNASADPGEVPFIWTKKDGVKLLTELPGYTTNIWGMSPDGSLILGYSSPDTPGKPWLGTVWKNGKSMTTQSFLESIKVGGLAGWKTGQVRASSRKGAVLVGEGTTPAGKYVSWVVR